MKRVDGWLIERPALTGLLAFLWVTGCILVIKMLGNRHVDWQDPIAGLIFGVTIWVATASRRRRSRR